METMTHIDSLSPHLIMQEKPFFRLVQEIPDGMGTQIERCVMDFVKESHVVQGIDALGLFNQTIESIASATTLKRGGDFWLGTLNGRVVAYALGNISRDIDNRMTYWISQAFIARELRKTRFLHDCMAKIRARAKDSLCKHLMIVAGRNPKAYKRLFNFHDYAALLKEDI